MPTRTGVIGIDLGTSAVKVVLVDLSGVVRGTGTRPYPLRRPRPGAAESDPADWWAATVTAVRAALAEAGRRAPVDVAALAVDGQMHGLVLVDDRGRPLRPAMSWADTRAGDQLRTWTTLLPAQLRRLANPITPGMLGPQLAWVADHERGLLEAAAHALLPKDWLRQQLTGLVATDPSDASATLLWDLPADAWATDLMPALGLPDELLPPVRDSAQTAGVLLAEVAAELALPPGIPVAAGAGDTAAGLLATGLQVGQTQLTLGSGAQIVQLRERVEAVDDPVTHLYRAAEPRSWYAMAAVQNAGLALDWIRGMLGLDWAQLYATLETDSPSVGAAPVFLPYLTGERTPVLDDRVRASWHGLDLAHTREDLVRSAVLGVVCAVRHALDALPGSAPESVRVAGGGTADPRLRQLLADVLGIPVQPMAEMGVSALGAALLAARAAQVPLRLPPPALGEPESPGPRAAARQESYRRYRQTVSRVSG
jgi:xylulokinase